MSKFKFGGKPKKHTKSNGFFTWSQPKRTPLLAQTQNPYLAEPMECADTDKKSRIKKSDKKQHDTSSELLDIHDISTKFLYGSATSADYYQWANHYLDWNIDPEKPFKLNKKKLTEDEIAEYKMIGKPIEGQSYLELFDQTQVEDLFTILNMNASNATKGQVVRKELGYYGFEFVGEGTNIIVLAHKRYPGVVFKIALDTNGIADNFNDELLQYVIPRYARLYARHSTGIVSVQERYVIMNSRRMKDYQKDILKLLEKLSHNYLVADLSPVRFANFAVGRDGQFVIADGSDLYPIADMTHKVRCQNAVGWNDKKQRMVRCHGKLTYSTDFLSMVCEKCGRVINPLELRPKDKEGRSGMSQMYRDCMPQEEIDAMEQAEIEVVKQRIAKHNGSAASVIVSNGAKFEYADRPDVSIYETKEPHGKDSENSDIGTSQENIKPTFETPADDESEVIPEEYFQGMDLAIHGMEELSEEADEDDELEDAPVEHLNRPADTNSKFRMFAEAAAQASDADDIDEEEEDEDTDEEEPEELPDQPEVSAEELEALQNSMPQPEVEYSFVPVDIQNGIQVNDDRAGIYLNIHGDFDEAWDNTGLPIYVSVDNGKTYNLALNTTVLSRILKRVIEDLQETDDE